MSGSKKIPTSINLDADVRDYVQQLAVQAQRPRSWIINTLIRKHAQQVREEKVDDVIADPALRVISA